MNMKKISTNNRSKTFLAITIPIVLLFFTFNTMAVIHGFGYSLTNFRGFGSFQFVGLRNYIDLFSDSRVINSYIFTFGFAIVCTILVNVISLILALGLNSKIRAKGALRAIYFLPNILGGLVIGYVFNFFFTYILPAIGKAVGSGALSNSLLASPKTAWFALVICVAWQSIAMNTLIYISGLQTVPEDVYEAGEIDGAVGFKKFKNIMAGFAIGRNMKKKGYKFIYFYLISGMFVPFAIIMMPIVKQTAIMGIANRFGVVLLYVVFNLPMNLMLYTGYLKNIPLDLEEAASIDGASTWKTYWKVIFPLMKPMHATVAVLTALGTWNDVMLPLILLSGTGQNTLPIAQLNFQSQFGTNYNLAFASYLLALIPILIFYVFCQKHIINGVVNGAVK